MARFSTPTIETTAAWDAWVTKRPHAVKGMIANYRLDPWTLYRLKSTSQRVYLMSFNDNGTVKVAVTGEFNLVTHERAVFGIDPADLEECDLPHADELLGSLELPVAEIKRLMMEGAPPGSQAARDYMEHAARTRTLKTYSRDWPKKGYSL